MRQEIVNSEVPIATEENVAYARLPENEENLYAEIGEYLYAGEVEVKQYDKNTQPRAEDQYHGNVGVKTYDDTDI